MYHIKENFRFLIVVKQNAALSSATRRVMPRKFGGVGKIQSGEMKIILIYVPECDSNQSSYFH